MVNREELFYKKLTEEYDTFMEEIRDWGSEKVVENSEYIADYRNIYEYTEWKYFSKITKNYQSSRYIG